MELKHRDIQTKIKHEILEQYLVKWYSIITKGLSGRISQNPSMRQRFRTRFIYVDYFAYTGAYEENGGIVDGSPVIGIKALDELRLFFQSQAGGLTPSTIAILFEEDAKTFQNLVSTLSQLGYGNRLKYFDKGDQPGDRDIFLIKGDSSQYVDRVLKFIEGNNQTFAFHFIDPYGAKAVERRNIERIVSSKGADCIINMMLDPIYRFLVPASQNDAERSEEAKAEYYDKFLGSDIWRGIAREMEAKTIGRKEAEYRLVNAFEEILTSADEKLGVKQIRLQFPEWDQTYYHLFLTTHDSTGAFAMNEIIDAADIRQYDYREEHRQMKFHADQTSFDFLTEMTDEKRPVEPEPDIDLLADQIYLTCIGKTLTYKAVLDTMIRTPYYQSDMRAALGKLRQQKRADFDGTPSSMPNKTQITFV